MQLPYDESKPSTPLRTILYIHHGKGLGGAPISLLTLIKGLDRERFRPLVLFLYDSAAIDLFRQEKIEVFGPINLSDFSHTQVYWFRWYHPHHLLKALFQSLLSFFVAYRLLKKIRPDAVHLNTSTLTAWGLAAHHLKIPVAWHIRESLAPGYLGFRRWIIKNIISRCATIILPICKTDGRFWKDNKKTVLYNPVDTARFNPALSFKSTFPSLNETYLLFVGGLSHQKGTDFLLQVFEKVNKALPYTKLIIAGHFEKPVQLVIQRWSPEKQYAAAAYQKYERLKNQIVLTGPTTAIPSLMQQAALILFPAQVDHFARPIIEAGCMRKPVLASDFPQLREIVLQEKTGYLLPPTDVEAWAKKIIELVQAPNVLTRLGEENYTFCKNNFALEGYAQQVEQVYRRLFTPS